MRRTARALALALAAATPLPAAAQSATLGEVPNGGQDDDTPNAQFGKLVQGAFSTVRVMLRADIAEELDRLASLPPEARKPEPETPSDDEPPIQSEAADQETKPAPDRAQREPQAPLPSVYLGGLFYFGPDNWSFWLNEREVNPATTLPDFKIVAVRPNAVKLRWSPENRGETFQFTLHPRQTFVPETGRVVEGRVTPDRAKTRPSPNETKP